MADLGTLPQQITAFSSGGIFLALVGLVLKWNLGTGRLSNEAQRQRNANSADIRNHYAEELSRVIERQRACELREEALRSRVAELESDILGLIGIIRQASTDKVLSLGPEASETIRNMARRIANQRALG